MTDEKVSESETMVRLEVRTHALMESVVYQPGNGERYDLLIGVHNYADNRMVSLVWLNRDRGLSRSITVSEGQCSPYQFREHLCISYTSATALCEIALEYLKRDKNRPNWDGAVKAWDDLSEEIYKGFNFKETLSQSALLRRCVELLISRAKKNRER